MSPVHATYRGDRLGSYEILAIFDFGIERGTAYAVMELLDGETLRQKLALPVPVRKAVDYAAQIARGLAAAHQKGIVHRDVKPENAGAAGGDATYSPTLERHTDPGTVL